MSKLEWVEGAPEVLEEGMLCEDAEGVYVVGRKTAKGMRGRQPATVLRWAWLIKPYELAWEKDMIGKRGYSTR